MSLYTQFFIENGVDVLSYLNTIIPSYCFYGITTDIYKGIEIVNIPAVKRITWGAFQESDIRYVYIPESVRTIDPNAFRHCPYLEEVHIEGNPKINMQETFDTYNDIEFVCYHPAFYESCLRIAAWSSDTWEVVKGE